jgi:hypothetical protein
MKHQNEIIIYSPDTSININVLLEDDTVRLSQIQMAELFDTTVPNINTHLKNVFEEKGLEEK